MTHKRVRVTAAEGRRVTLPGGRRRLDASNGRTSAEATIAHTPRVWRLIEDGDLILVGDALPGDAPTSSLAASTVSGAGSAAGASSVAGAASVAGAGSVAGTGSVAGATTVKGI